MEATNTSTSFGTWQQAIERVSISDNTRQMLMIWAKLQDADDEYVNLLTKIYGEDRAGSLAEKFIDGIGVACTEIIDGLTDRIYDTLSRDGNPEI